MKRSFFRFFLPLTVAACMLLSGCGEIISSAEDIPGHSVGVIVGTASLYYADHYAALGSQVIAYESAEMLGTAISAGYVDCGIADLDSANTAAKSARRVKILDSNLADDGYCVAVALENPRLLENINGVLATMTENGSLKSLVSAYLGGKTQKRNAPEKPFEHTLTVAVDDTTAPYAYTKDGALDGLNVALGYAIGDSLGVNIEFITAASADLMEEVRKGNADFALGTLVQTEETAELVLFSTPYVEVSQALLVRK